MPNLHEISGLLTDLMSQWREGKGLFQAPRCTAD